MFCVPQIFLFLSCLLSAPTRAPDMVKTYNTSSMSLIVEWNHIGQEHFQGQPIGYSVKYSPIDLGSDINFISINFASNTTKLTNLTVYTMYEINVSAVSSGGTGPANTIKTRTGAERKYNFP